MLKWLPANVSTYGGQIDRLFSIIEWITGITFVVVIVLLLLFIIKYRDQGGRRATYTHGSLPTLAPTASSAPPMTSA